MIFGGGVIGASIAYHLAAAGVREVVLVNATSCPADRPAKPLAVYAPVSAIPPTLPPACADWRFTRSSTRTLRPGHRFPSRGLLVRAVR
ncbi:FAD-binding oxidoreductase [Mycobacterium sp. URHB0021]